MRILYVTADLPWPLTSGYLRHYHLIRGLAEQHRITLLSLVAPGHEPGDRAALGPLVDEIVEAPIRRPRSFLGRVRHRLAVARSGGEPAAHELGRAAADLTRGGGYDAVLLSGRRTLPVLDGLAAMPLVADLCDATSTRIRGQLRDAAPAQVPLLALEYLEVRRAERELLARARHAVFASVRDRAALVRQGTPEAERAWVVPNGVELGTWQRRSRALGRDAIVLTGAMDYPPNVDAAVRLVEHVYPLVRAERPDARVVIVGRDPSPTVRRLGDAPGVEVTGFVPDVRPYLEDAAVFAAPLRHGAGIQNKVLEALAMEVPVVASPLAAAGLRPEDGSEPPIDVGHDSAELARHIVRRLDEARAGAEADPARRAFVARYFDWDRNAERLGALLADAAGLPGGTA